MFTIEVNQGLNMEFRNALILNLQMEHSQVVKALVFDANKQRFNSFCSKTMLHIIKYNFWYVNSL